MRSAHLRHHKNQVAFPGGQHDAGDDSLIATALRETEEEIAIAVATIEVIGTLPSVDSNSGFRVTPVIGLIPPQARWQVNSNEVADIFEIPLAEALDSRQYLPLNVIQQQQVRRVWLRHYKNHLIWGMTAAILLRLAAQINSESYRSACCPALTKAVMIGNHMLSV